MATHPRYVLALENGCYFDGTGWTPNQKKAIRYASLPVIKTDFKRLEKEIKSGLIELTGTFVVRITGVKELTAKQVQTLAWYLSGASVFTLDYTVPRPSGLEGIVISTQIHWCDLRLKKQE